MTRTAPSRSWISAGWTSAPTSRPPVSVTIWRADAPQEGSGFDLLVPRQKHGYSAGHHHTRAAAGGARRRIRHRSAFWPSRGRATWIQRQLAVCLPGMITATLGTRHTRSARRTCLSRRMSGPFASVPSWRLPRHPRLNVIATRLDRPLPGLQLRMEHVPDMNHFGPDLQIDADISGARGFGQRDRVVEQSFCRADLDQEWRQPFEI